MSLTRLKHILDLVSYNGYPAIEDIIKYLQEKDIIIDKRTFHRDKNKLAADFSLFIDYDSQKRGYFLNRTESLNPDETIRFLAEMEAANSIRSLFGDNRRNTGKYISFARDSQTSGSVFLNELLEAVVNQQVVSFRYQKYSSSVAETKTIEPYFIKEHNHIWYVYGRDTAINAYRTYGMNRINDLSVTDKAFRRDPDINPSSEFRSVIGVYTEPEKQAERILIRFSGSYIDRIKHNKIHHSQRITEETPEYIIIELNLIPTSEFYTELLKYRKYATVLSPASVRGKVKDMLGDALSNYQ